MQQSGKSTLRLYQAEHFYSFSNWLPLQQSHTASFIFQKNTSDWSRWEQIKTDCTEQPQSNGELGILSKYKKPMCLTSELETELFHRSFEVLA